MPHSLPNEIDHDFSPFSLLIRDRQTIAVARLELVEQRQRIVIVHESHGLARVERVESAENSGVTKAFRDSAGVEGILLVG